MMSRRRRDDSDAMARFAWRALWGTLFTFVLVVLAIVTLRRRNRDQIENVNFLRYVRIALTVAGIALIAFGTGYVGQGYDIYRDAQSIQTTQSNYPYPSNGYRVARLEREAQQRATTGVWLISFGGLALVVVTRLPNSLRVRSVAPPVLEQAIVYTIAIPRTTAKNHDLALMLIDKLLFAFPYLGLRIKASRKQVKWQLLDLHYNLSPETIEHIIRSSYPGAEVTHHLEGVSQTSSTRVIGRFGQFEHFVCPLRYLEDFAKTDPLTALTEFMSELEKGEYVHYTLFVMGAASRQTYREAQKHITQSAIHPLQFLIRGGTNDAAFKVISGNDRTERFIPRDQRIMEEKLRQRLFNVLMAVEVEAPTETRMKELLYVAESHFANYMNIPYQALQMIHRLDETTTRVSDDNMSIASTIGLYQAQMLGEATKLQRLPRMVLETREIAALWHLPNQEFSGAKIRWGTLRVAPSPKVIENAKGSLLGTAFYRGRPIPVYLNRHDRRQHVNIVGKTGMGKSNLMHNMIHNDIAEGCGVAVIDPHGSLVEAIVERSIPDQRWQDVVIVDINNPHNPPPLNPMRTDHLVTGTGRVVDVIESLFEGSETYVRVAKYLRASAALLVNDPQATMRDLSRVFTDDAYRRQLLEVSTNPFAIQVWDDYEFMSVAQRRQMHEPIMSRLTPFYGNPVLYPMLCHPDTLPLREWMANKKIILVSLNIPETAVPQTERNLIGSFLISMLQTTAMQHPMDDTFYVYIDEVQRFVTTSLPILFSEARKFGLSMTVANQFLGQLQGATLDAIMGNVGTSIVFRCSPDDAKMMGVRLRPQFQAEQLVMLERYTAAVTMQHEGEISPPFTLETLPPLDRPDDWLRYPQLRATSAHQFMPRTRDEVLTWLQDRYPRQRPPSDTVSFYDAQ
ncbi:MAG: type IV secretion system DNA-binding domain-containing protein [Anaerolineales bacterium]|nr:type IV secretion system DNA-binding domain-containing protein [Anaerolineales bacterium]